MVSISHSAAAETLISLEKSIKCEEIVESIEPDLNFISIQDATTEDDYTTEHHLIDGDIPKEQINCLFKCPQCKFSSSSFEDLLNHFSKHREKDPYKCFQCGTQCEDKQDFIDHSHSHLIPKYFKCHKCPFNSEDHSAIELHMQAGHNDIGSSKSKVHQCPICEKYFDTQARLKGHLGKCGIEYMKSSKSEDAVSKEVELGIKEEDSGKDSSVFTCPFCFFIFTSKEKASKHISIVHFKNKGKIEKAIRVKENSDSESEDVDSLQDEDIEPDMNPSVKLERIYLCPICHYVFTSVSSLNKHVVSHKNVTECPICQFECETNNELKAHIETHSSGDTNHFCTVCNMNFETLSDLTSHIKERHSKTFKCPYCPRTIKTENALQLHIEAHSKLKEYYCPKCNFTAKNSAVLQFHMSRYHRQKKRFVCGNCPKSYKFKFSLQRHIENCPGKELDSLIQVKKKVSEIEIDLNQEVKVNFSCSECDATFEECSLLKKHLMIHFRKFPFRCIKCGFRCESKFTLSQHLKKHKIAASYECRICKKKFQLKHALNNHLITHNDERPFTCEICGMGFKRKSNYRRHYDGHTDSRPFKCESCEYTTRRKDALLRHLIQHEES